MQFNIGYVLCMFDGFEFDVLPHSALVSCESNRAVLPSVEVKQKIVYYKYER